ncbi:methylcobamide--CoM methyltransferase [Treponema sp.]
MHGRELIRASIEGQTGQQLPFMPVTMSFAARLIGVPYKKYATDYRAQVEGQLRCAELFGIDHVSVISDPAVEASDLGGGVIYFENDPPSNDDAASLLIDKSRLASLSVVDPSKGKRMNNRLEAVAALHSRIGTELMVEGWVEGPCAEASDLRGISRLMMDFFDDPAFIKDLMEFVKEQGIAFALAQIAAGAEIIGIGDAASSLVGPSLFTEYIKDHHKAYVKAIHDAGALARCHICGNTTEIIPLLHDVPYDIIDLDTMSSVAKARKALGPDRVLLGNIDTVSVVRGGTVQDVERDLALCFADAERTHYVVGAGCEVPGDSPEANMLAMRNFARSHQNR